MVNEVYLFPCPMSTCHGSWSINPTTNCIRCSGGDRWQSPLNKLGRTYQRMVAEAMAKQQGRV